MINYINIYIKEGFYEKKIVIDYPKKILYYNDNLIQLEDDFLDKLLNIIVSFDNEYGYSNKIDDNEFRIEVISNNGKECYHGQGFFPEHYSNLLELVGEIDE